MAASGVFTNMKRNNFVSQVQTISQEDSSERPAGATSTASMFTKFVKPVMVENPNSSHRRPITASAAMGAHNQ